MIISDYIMPQTEGIETIGKCVKPQSSQYTSADYLEQNGIHVREALKYFGDDFSQYIHLLSRFISDNNLKKLAEIQQAYDTQDWKDYTIYIHGLKTVARTIGADALADLAYEHEKNSKEGNIAFVQEYYADFVQKYYETRNIIISYFHRNDGDKVDEKRVTNETSLTQETWCELIEQTISCLKQYKKKEALLLLEKLLNSSPAKEQKETLEQAVKFVQEYDYEQAVYVLRRN